MSRIELLTSLLYRHDLEGLAKGGAPRDEYKSEAKMILEEMAKRNDVTPSIMHEVMADVFARMFTLHKEPAKVRHLASEKFRQAAEDAVVSLW